MYRHDRSRRQFLRAASQSALGVASAYTFLGSLQGIGLSAAQAAATDYRALVCVYLGGGNDGYNLLVPTDAGSFAAYQKARGARAIGADRLLPVKTRAGDPFGLHPSVPDLQSLFTKNRIAFVSNVGSLVAPIVKADYTANRNLPVSLFSHHDQEGQWMVGDARMSASNGGWGGRLADLMMSNSAGQSQLAMNVSVAGINTYQAGRKTVPYGVATTGAVKYSGAKTSASRAAAIQSIRDEARAGDEPLAAYLASVAQTSADLADVVGDALDNMSPLSTRFPDSSLGQQLAMVARMIAVRSQVGAPNRQIFFVTIDGYDTHDGQDDAHAALLKDLNDTLKAFYDATVEMGVASSVTTFTHSEFGRTLNSNGDGTDHGWGSHHLVMGDAVLGRRIFGTLPDLTPNSNDDVGRGRMLPTTAVDQYAATLAKWLGASRADVRTVFPNITRFDTANLGFLSA